MLPEDVARTGADIILANTYHLMLRPGAERIAKLGGLHQFMNWDGPILTDSGGYQVMSLSSSARMTEEGVRFQSAHRWIATISSRPERAMEIQSLLGSDIQMVLDECPPFPATEAETQPRSHSPCAGRSGPRTRSPAAPGRLFGIVQGGVYPQFADAIRTRADRDRLRRLCGRRARGGRGAGRDVRRARGNRAASARATARAT